MPRLPKIQGAISPELHDKFLNWKRDNGYRSQGEALSELLTQFFDGDNGDNETGYIGDIGDNEYPESPVESRYHRYNETPNDNASGEKVKELEEKIKLLEDNQINQCGRIDELEGNLEGLSCTLPYGDGSVGNSPHDVTSKTYTGNTNSDYTYTANTLATEVGLKSRTVREKLQKLEIGDIYPRKGKQYKLISKSPYKLVLIE